MGLKVPDDTDYIIGGRQCNACTPELWAPGMTSKYVWAIFFDIEACPGHVEPPNNHVFKLEQSPIDACTWNFEGDKKGVAWRVQWSAFQGWLLLDHIDDHAVHPYFESVRAQCATYWDVNVRNCVNSGGHKGRGVVGIMEDNLIHSLTMDYHFVPRDRTFYERQDDGIDHVCVRLACRKYSSNILIYIDYEDFEYVESPL